MVKKNALKNDSGQEDFKVRMIETEEIDYDLDADIELEKDYSLIKYEFNMVELPFFTKDKKIEEGKARKYTFSKKDESYMRIVPSGDPELISNKIPQEFDEKIFYGILKLSKEQGSKMEIVTDYFTLAKVSGTHYNNLERIKDSLQRLSGCKVELNNLMYSKELRMKVRGNKPFPILEHVHTYTFEQAVEMPESKYSGYFKNRRINEILVIKFGTYLFQNVQQRGFLYFDQKKLLEISNATARKIYLMATKWNGYEKKNEVKRSCRFIASRIPLSWETKNIGNTVRIIEKSCETLKGMGMIKDYSFIKTKPVSNSFVTLEFDKDHNQVEAYNYKASNTPTGHEDIIIDSVEDEFLVDPVEDDRQTTMFDLTEMEIDPVEEEEKKQKEKTKKIREKAHLIYENLKGENRTKYEEKAKTSKYYKIMLENRINNGSISKEEAIKEAVIMFIIGEMDD